MIKAQIIIEMKDGALYSYANHFLEEKDDVVDRKGNYTFKGEPGKYYMYTGEDGDEYKDQNEPGMAKADYEYLLKDVKKLHKTIILLRKLRNNLYDIKQDNIVSDSEIIKIDLSLIHI